MRKNFKLSLTAASLLVASALPGAQMYANSNAASAAPKSPAATLPAPEARTVTGTVVDANDGEPLISATVMVKGDPRSAAITDLDGKFSIKIKAGVKKPVLVFTYVGYEKTEVPVEDMSNINVQMKPLANTINDVVVVGSGIQKKVSVTGAISQVGGEELKLSTSTLSSSLAGKFAGVFANNSSGQPGTGADFYIRGISNFSNKSATPLILLDDVEISASDLDYIPAENIASFSVLKDASATAIYGARGANGVMIVTTKGGEYNTKTTVSVTLENAFNILDNMPEFVDGTTYMTLFNKAQAMRNPTLAPRYTQETIDRTATGENPYLYPDVNWQKTLFKNLGMRQRANVNISGGGNKVKYYMSLEFNHDDGHYRTKKLYSWRNQIEYYNYTFQNNISYKLTPSTTLSANLNAQIRQGVQPNINAESLFAMTMNYNPVLLTPMYPSREGYDHILFGTYRLDGASFTANPFAEMNTSYWKNHQTTINAVVKLNQDLDFITKGLKLQAWVNFKSWASRTYSRSIAYYRYLPAESAYAAEDWQNPVFDLTKCVDGQNYISEGDFYNYNDNTFELQANLNWNRSFGDHNITAMALYRMREYNGDEARLPNRNQGFSGRVTYDYAHRYLLEFNCGYNGTERLAKGHRFGFFPAGSIGWVMSNEKFWEPLTEYVDNFKIRASYGLVGSDDLVRPNGTYFLYYDQIRDNNLSYLSWYPGTGGSAGWGSSYGGPDLIYAGVTDLGWEKVKKFDVGIDIRLFNQLNITLDYFRDVRSNMFMQRQSWPSMLGYGSLVPYAAVGKISNQGIEGSLNWDKQLTPDLNINVTANFTYNKNKLINCDELNYTLPWMRQTGLPVDHTRGYIAEGLFRSQEEIDNSPVQNLGSTPMVGDIKYRDLNGDGKINQEDQTIISPYGTVPRLQYGFGATIQWKKWDLGFFFTGSAKRTLLLTGSMMNGVNNDFMPFRNIPGVAARNSLQWIADNYFDPEKGNFDAEYPRLGTNVNDVANNTVASTFWTRSGAFLRLRNIELGWSFPFGRVYVSAVNLFNFTSFKLWDPELKRWNSYPLQKSINLGVKFNF